MKILIINSQGHWMNGWMSFPKSLETVVKVLEKTGCDVKTVEVQSLNELEQVLQATDQDTLIWANAYWVNGKNGTQHGLVEQIQKYNLPMLGSSLATLLRLLEKDTCQKMLKEANIPIPDYLIIDQNNIDQAHDLIKNMTLTFPLVIKPTKESRSQGIKKVHNRQETIATFEALRHKFPNSNIIIEEFLPNDDITCGYLKLGSEIMLLPSYNVVRGMDCSTEIFSEAHYKLPPSYEQQVLIQDANTLHQLEMYLPLIVDLLAIRSTTRVDARLDKNGVLKFFDINGMPGLNYPISALIKQCFVHFPNYDEAYLFECLINTIVAENLQQYDMPVPALMQTHHLFNLKSETIIKISSKYEKTRATQVG